MRTQPSPWEHMAKINLGRLQGMLEQNPHRTLQSLADEFDCSRERIRQVLNKHGSNWTQRIIKRNPIVFCACGNRATGKTGICRACYLKNHHQSERMVLECDYCGGTFSLRLTEVAGRIRLADKIHPGKNKRWYCSFGCLTEGRRKENR